MIFLLSCKRPLALLLTLILLAGCAQSPQIPAPQEPVSEPQAAAPPPVLGPIDVIAVGDIMLGTDFPENRLPADDGFGLLAPVADILRNADITFGNQEGTLLSGGEPAKLCKDIRRCYLFRSPPRYAQALARAGFDVMSLANNHARDFGEEGRAASMAALAAAGIHHSGLEGDIASWTVKGRRVAMIAYAPFRGAHNPLEPELAQATVRALAAEHDLVIVSMHMGTEGAEAMRIPFAEEYFHGELRGDVVAFSRAVVDAGADLVLGHGPHVPRALELYQERLIAYSLGNFCTYYGINVQGLNGLAPILKVRLDGEGRFLGGKIISTRQVRPNGPLPDPSHDAARLMARLTGLDFPDTPLAISDDGELSRKTITPAR